MTNRSDLVQNYLQRLHDLHANMRRWLEDKGVRVDSEPVQIHEEGVAKYMADQLLIADINWGTVIARVCPIGQNILLASGRVDLIGNQGKESFLYLDDGKTLAKTTSDRAGSLPSRIKKTVVGPKDDGWYWLEGRMNRWTYPLDETLFLELFSEVSGHIP